MENQSETPDPDIPSGETLLWEGRPSVWRWSEGDGSYWALVAFLAWFPCVILGVMFFGFLPNAWGARNFERGLALGFLVSPLLSAAVGYAFMMFRRLGRSSTTRYLITDQSVILVHPYGSILSIPARRQKYVFRDKILTQRKLERKGVHLNLFLGKERHHFAGNWLRADRERWVILGIKDCPGAELAESILDALHGPPSGSLSIVATDLFSQRAAGIGLPFLDGPTRSSVLFITGKNTPLASIFQPKIPITFAKKTDDEILGALLGPGEMVLWKGRAQFEPFQDLDWFQKATSLAGIVLSPILIWVGIQILLMNRDFRAGALMIVLGLMIVFWADAIFFGRWSVKRIVERAFYCITDRRVLVVHPFGPNLRPFEQPFYSFDRFSIAHRMICQTPQGMAIIFQSKETLSGNDQLEIENIGIVACADWATAEEVLVKWFDQETPPAPN